MSYRVEYRQAAGKGLMRPLFLTVACFLIFLVLVFHRWPEGAEMIRALCSGLKNSKPVTVLNHFAGELVNGESVKQAFSDFLELLQS